MTVTTFPDRPQFILVDDLAEVFGHLGLPPPRGGMSAGRQAKINSPCQVRQGKRAAPDFSIALDADGMGMKWNCKRANNCSCSVLEKEGGARVRSHSDGERRLYSDQPMPRLERVVVKPKPHTPEQQQKPESLYDFFAKRGISAETVDAFGIYGTAEKWPESGADGETAWVQKPTIVFPYVWKGELVSRKFRSIDKRFRQDKDSLRALFNADAITSPDEVIWVEGEMDVLALWEAGVRQVVSLPDGAPPKLYDEDDPRRQDDKRFDAIENCAEVIKDVQRIIIATDADMAGGYLAEELTRRLGPHRCWRVTWPDGCKDANDVLLKHGADALRECIANAEQVPLAGVWEPKVGSLSAFLRTGMRPRGLECGIGALDDVARLPSEPGRLVTVTGVPAHGKTSCLAPWLTRVAQIHDRGIIWCSPEDGRPEVAALRLVQIMANQPVEEAGGYMPDDILAKHEAWIRRRVSFLWSDNPDVEMTIDWVIERAEQAKRRKPAHFLVLDPWSDFEHHFGKNESETQYINRTLIRLKKWGRMQGLTIIVAAHPQKLAKNPNTGKWPVAGGYDISGSANWFNRTDLGVTVFRESDGEVQVHNWKAKYLAYGRMNTIAKMKFDQRTGRLSSPHRTDEQEDQP